MRIYIAARYGRRAEMASYADELRDVGHTVVCRWLDGGHTAEGDEAATHAEKQTWALDDIADITAADTLITFTEPAGSRYGRGGRHVELGYALALGREVIVIGYQENVFHSLPGVVFFASWEEFAETLKGKSYREESR